MGFPAKNKSEDWRDRLGWGEREEKQTAHAPDSKNLPFIHLVLFSPLVYK